MPDGCAAEAVQMEECEIQDRLLKIYELCNPEKVALIPKIMSKYTARPTELFTGLQEKYSNHAQAMLLIQQALALLGGEATEPPPEFDPALQKTSVRLCCTNTGMHKLVLNKEVHTVGHLRWHASQLGAAPPGMRTQLFTTNPETFYEDDSQTLKEAGLCSAQVFQKFV